jgi:chromatin licensing and DNA replication factor 1
MKPEMKIELLLDVVDGHNELSDYIALQKLFASRLNNFFAAHPEACAIPEAILPEPFNRTTQTSLWEENLSEVSHCQSNLNIVDNTTVPEQSPGESSTQPQGTDPLSQFSLVHPSFKRHFSTKIIAEMQKTELLPSPAPLLPTSSYSCDAKDIPSQLQDFPDSSSKSAITVDKDIRTEQPRECVAASSKFTIASVSPCNIESPMSKPASSSDNLVVETPVQLTPRRSMPSCDEKLKMTSGHNLSASNKPAKRSLKFSTLECDISTTVEDSTVGRLHLDKVKCDNSVQGLEIEKVKKSVVTDLAKDCKKMSDGLVDLVTLINHIFQSANRSSITKEELVHKIIINDFDTVERGEVQEKIELLEKLVPDWISRKLVSSGDTLYSIQKASDMELVQSRLKMSGKAGSECRL